MKPTKEMICSDEGTEHQATTNKQTNKQTKSTHHEEIKGLSDLSSLLTLETS
jgi:hypothetical protein